MRKVLHVSSHFVASDPELPDSLYVLEQSHQAKVDSLRAHFGPNGSKLWSEGCDLDLGPDEGAWSDLP